jgi:hypothetical protein
MYQYNDRLTQLVTKYKYIWLWLQCFDPYLGHHAYTRCDKKLSRLIVFFDMEIIVHYEYVPQSQTVNQQFYLQVLKRLRLSVSRKRPQKRVAGTWPLHHDNAPAHKAHSIQIFFGKSWHSCRSATTLLP